MRAHIHTHTLTQILILLTKAHLPLRLSSAAEDQPDVSVVLSAYSQQGDPALYGVYYSGLKKFIESVLDCHRAELSQVFYPLFVHMYLELVYNNHENEAKLFYEKCVFDTYCTFFQI